ncbi:MAG: ATP-binding protein, partial [Candidatus Rokuibacteriota bacterium]
APAILWSTDIALRFTSSLGAGLQAQGLQPNQVVGLMLGDYFQSDDPDFAPIAAHGRALRGESASYQYTWNGRTYESHVEPLRDHDGMITGTVGVALDVSERTAAEEEAKMQRDFALHVINAMGQGVVVTDADFRFEYVNPEFARLLGYSPESLLGKTGFDIVVSEDHDIILRARERRGQGKTVAYEVRLRHADGREVPVLATGAPRLRNGKVVGSVTAVTDLTERKRAEETRLAKEAAEEANKAKGEFLSRMSHELRTPLNAILGFAQLLEMDSLAPAQRESVEHILHGGRHLLELINEVLDISRIDEGRLRISLEPVSVREVVEESIRLITPLAAEGEIRVKGNIDAAGDRHVRADRQRLKQVLLNLLANAVKYNRKPGAVEVTYQESPPGRLRIKVADTGAGIKMDRIERLFTPFERLGADEANVEGTGLGLALSKRLVEAMGGRIGVESAIGEGSTFWVEFAVVQGPMERLKRLGGTPTGTNFEGTLRPRVVLYAEDNLANLKLVQYLLADRPEVRLLPATHGALALSLARDHRPHLILLDLDLADMPGEEVLRQLKAHPETLHIPVVVVTASNAHDSMERLLAAGAYGYLTKPLDIQRLLALLDSLNERTEPA